jgi:acetyltransferase-like isoleucine patch superfamily enzyme
MIHDHRPYRAKKLYIWLESLYAKNFVLPHFETVGADALLMKPWNINVHGAHIRAGKNLHIITASDRKVALSTWTFGSHQGHIEISDNCLICPGVRIDSASTVVINDNCMLAAGAYITDADWHDIYDRTRAIGATAPVTLADNVWVGDGATLCKGVTVGRNSIIGAGAVVVSDIPANVIAAGNPARVVKELDPNRELVTRAALFADPAQLALDMDRIDRYILNRNSYLRWLRTLL